MSARTIIPSIAKNTRFGLARSKTSLRPFRTVGVSVHASSADPVSLIKQKNEENPVMVYSKTYCPFCSEVKSLFSNLAVEAKVVDLDTLADGDAIQDALMEVSGMRTVPQVFIGGELVGGCDDTMGAYRNGTLVTLLKSVGITPKAD